MLNRELGYLKITKLKRRKGRFYLGSNVYVKIMYENNISLSFFCATSCKLLVYFALKCFYWIINNFTLKEVCVCVFLQEVVSKICS